MVCGSIESVLPRKQVPYRISCILASSTASDLESSLSPTACGLSFGKSWISPRQCLQIFFGCVQRRACPLNVDFVSKLGTVSQDCHDVVVDFGKASTHS